jgi:dolichol-phosphate mannosyltransferase
MQDPFLIVDGDQLVKIDLSVILPTLNEAENLLELIPNLYFELGSINVRIEVIIVDDSSDDSTDEVVIDLRNRFPNLRCISRKGFPRSLPNSIRVGIEHSRGQSVCWMDADGSMQPSVLKDMLAARNETPENDSMVVIASRFVQGGGVKGKNVVGPTPTRQLIRNLNESEDYLFAVFLSWSLNKVLWFMLLKYCRDSTSGFILLPRCLVEKYTFDGTYGDYFPRLIEHFRSHKIKLIEVPYVIQIRRHGVSKTGSSPLRILRSGIPYVRFIWDLFLVRLKPKSF